MEIAVENKKQLADLYDNGILPDLEPGADVVLELERYRQIILTFINENTNPEFAKQFPLPKDKLPKLDDFLFAEEYDDGKDYAAVTQNDASFVNNLKAINNALLLIEKLYPILNQSSTVNKIFDITLLSSEIYQVLSQFDPQMSHYSRAFLGYIRSAYREDFKNFKQFLPQLTKYAEDAKLRWGEKVYEPFKLMLEKVDTILINPPEFSEDVGNKDLLEKLVVELYPDFEQHINDKDENGLYDVTNKDDSNTVRLIKAVTNTLELHSKLLMQDTTNKTLFQIVLDAINSGTMIQQQLWSIECSAAIREQAGNGMAIICGELTKTLSVLREFVVEVDHAEEELFLKKGYLFDQIKPWLETFLRLAEQAGVELTDGDKNLFEISRNVAREQRYQQLQQQLVVSNELAVRVSRMEEILFTSQPINEFDTHQLILLRDNLSLLQLPHDLHQNLINEVEVAIHRKNDDYDVIATNYNRLANLWGRAKNLAGHNISEQNQARYIASQFEKFVETEQNDLRLRLAAFVQVSPALSKDLPNSVVNNEMLTDCAKQIKSKRFSLQFAVQQFRIELIENIDKHCDDTIVENLKSCVSPEGYFETYVDDAADLCNLKFILNALHRLDKVFDVYDKRDYIAFYGLLAHHGYQVIKALDKLKLDSKGYLGKYHLVRNLIANTKTDLGDLYGKLLDESSQILLLKPGQSVVQNPQDVPVDYLKMTEDFASEWISTIKEFKSEQQVVQQRTVQEDYIWLATECRVVEERIFTFLDATFHDDLTKYIDRNNQLFYTVGKDDPALIKDVKHLLNAMHHFTRFAEARGTDPYNLKLPIWLHRINQFTITLNKIDLSEAHDEVQILYRLVLAMGQKVMDTVADPVALDLLTRAEEIEAFGFKHGTFTRPLQYAVEQYQTHSELVGLKITDEKKDGFLAQRMARRQENIDHIERCLKDLGKSLIVLNKLNGFGEEIKAGKYKTIKSEHAQAILRHLHKFGFDQAQTNLYKVVLTSFANPDQKDLAVRTESATIKKLLDRVAACQKAVEEKQIEMEHQLDILYSHQRNNNDRLLKAKEVREQCALVDTCIRNALKALDKNETSRYHQYMEQARTALACATAAEKQAKSLKAGNLLQDAQYKIKETEAGFVEWVNNKFKPIDTESDKRKNPFAQVFKTPPKNFFELVVKFFEIIVVVFKTIFSAPQSGQLKKGQATTTHLNKSQGSEQSATNLAKYGAFKRKRGIDAEDVELTEVAAQDLAERQVEENREPPMVPPVR